MIVGVGIDLVEISRMERILSRTRERFLARVFTTEERRACDALGGGAARWAARFAGKEAVMKALGTGWGQGVGWHDVEILRSADGSPRVCMSGGALDAARVRGADTCHISLTHEKQHAAAVAVLESGSLEAAT